MAKHVFKGQSVLITGASSGIGRLLALRLAREGARLGLMARRVDRLEALAAEIRGLGGEALVLPGDVSNREEAEDCARGAVEGLGQVDILVNNAGYGRHLTFLEWPVEDIERMTRVNYLGAVYMTKALLPAMLARGQGLVVFVASMAGKVAIPEESAYAATKFALVGLAESLGQELEGRGVDVLTICPGAIQTDFFDEAMLARLPEVARRSMVQPEGLVAEIVRAMQRGDRELTYPKGLGLAVRVKGAAPELFRLGTRLAMGRTRG